MQSQKINAVTEQQKMRTDSDKYVEILNETSKYSDKVYKAKQR